MESIRDLREEIDYVEKGWDAIRTSEVDTDELLAVFKQAGMEFEESEAYEVHAHINGESFNSAIVYSFEELKDWLKEVPEATQYAFTSGKMMYWYEDSEDWEEYRLDSDLEVEDTNFEYDTVYGYTTSIYLPGAPADREGWYDNIEEDVILPLNVGDDIPGACYRRPHTRTYIAFSNYK